MASSRVKLWRLPILHPRDGLSDFSVDEKQALANQDTRYHVTVFLAYGSRWDLTSQLDVLDAFSSFGSSGNYIRPRIDIKKRIRLRPPAVCS